MSNLGCEGKRVHFPLLFELSNVDFWNPWVKILQTGNFHDIWIKTS